MTNCTNCDQVNDLWDENNKLKKAYDKVCAERDKLKEENNNWKIICNALVNNNDLPKYEGADDFKNV